MNNEQIKSFIIEHNDMAFTQIDLILQYSKKDEKVDSSWAEWVMGNLQKASAFEELLKFREFNRVK